MPPSVTHLLIHVVDVHRNTEVSAGKGRWTDTYVAHLTDIPFRVAGASANERMIGNQQKTYATHTGYGEPGLDIKRDDIITNVRREDGSVDSGSYRVTGEVPPSIGHHTKVLLEKIEKGA